MVGKNLSRRTAPIDIPEPIVYRPTMEELADFPGLVKRMEKDGAHHAGICKIVVPPEWVPRKKGYKVEDFPFKLETPLKQTFNQTGERGPQGAYQTKCMTKQPMSVAEYFEMATSSTYAPPPCKSFDDLERKYWRTLKFVPPVYGADVPMSLTDPEVDVFNIGKLDSILKYLQTDSETVYQGVNSPYLYFGMWKATFSWHVEDMDLYAINMIHYGAPKTWYCVPPKYGHLLERASRELFPNTATWCTNFMRHKSCLIDPKLLEEMGVPFQKMVQEEREAIIVFPYAYHSGFNHGFNIAESTNFAFERWIEYGKRHRPCSCARSRVKFDMSLFVKRFQPEKYEDWMSGRDIAPHPEDPVDLANEIRSNPENFRDILGNMKNDEHVYTFNTKDGRVIRYDALRDKLFTPLRDSDMPQFNEWKKKILKARQENFNKRVKVAIDVYKHRDHPDLEVKVFRDKSECMKVDLKLLRKALNKPDLMDVRSMIDSGELIWLKETSALKQQTLQSQPSQQEELPQMRKMMVEMDTEEKNVEAEVQKEKENQIPSDHNNKNKVVDRVETETSKKTERKISVYKHALEDFEYLVYADTKELVDEPTEELKAILENGTFADYIDFGIFQFVADFEPDMKESSKTEDDSKQAARDEEEEIKTPKDQDTYIVQLAVYEHKSTGIKIKVNRNTLKCHGRLPNRLKEFVGEKSMTDCIDEGIFTFVENTEMQRKKYQAHRVNEEPQKDGGDSERKVYHLYLHKSRLNYITVDPKNNKIVGRKASWLEGKTLEELKKAKMIKFIGEKIMSSTKEEPSTSGTKRKAPESEQQQPTSIAKAPLIKNTPTVERKPPNVKVRKFKLKNSTVSWVSVATCGSKTVCNFPALDEKVEEVLVENTIQDLIINAAATPMPEQNVSTSHLMTMGLLLKLQLNGLDDFKVCEEVSKMLDRKDKEAFSVSKRDSTLVVVDKLKTQTFLFAGSDEEIETNTQNESPEMSKEQESIPEPPKGEIVEEEGETYLIVNDDEVIDEYYDDEDFLSEDDSDIESSDADISSESEVDSDPDFSYGSAAYKNRSRGRRSRKKFKKNKRFMSKEERLAMRIARRAERRKGGMMRLNKDKYNDVVRNFFEKMQEEQYAGGGEERGSELKVFSLSTLVESGILTHKKSEMILPILEGFNVIQKRDQNSFVWLGVSEEKVTNILYEILDSPPPQSDDLPPWILCIEITRRFVVAGKGINFEITKLENTICYRDNIYEQQRHALKLTPICIVLEHIGILALGENRVRTVYGYNGPEIFSIWQQSQFDKYCNDDDLVNEDVSETKRVENKTETEEEKTHKESETQVASNNRVKFEPYKFRSMKPISLKGLVLPKSRLLGSMSVNNMVSLRRQLQTDQLKSMDISSLDQQQARSVKNNEISCSCGTAKYITLDSGKRKKVHTGFKKRSRCKTCTGCQAAKCMECSNCLNPKNKQACIRKVCLFPRIPRCPCFD